MKLAFPRDPFVQFTGVPDVIFKLAVTFGQLCGHYVNSRWRVAPARWTVSDRLAEDEFTRHTARLGSRRPGGLLWFRLMPLETI
jgi:hypothetical protein